MSVKLVSVPVGEKAASAAAYSMRRVQNKTGPKDINSSFRTPQEQRELFFDNYTSNYAESAKFDRKWYAGRYYWRQKGHTVNVAPPGTSKHGLPYATAFDVDTDSPIQGGLINYGSKYGFKRTLKSEPWHWEYTASNDTWRTQIRKIQATLSIGLSDRWGTGTDKAVGALRQAAYFNNYGDTTAEVKYLQNRVGVDDDGDPGAKTRAAVLAHVKQYQKILKTLGLYSGKIDGRWQSGTETAHRSARKIGYTP